LALLSPERAGLRVHLSADHGAHAEATVSSLAQQAMLSGEALRNSNWKNDPVRWSMEVKAPGSVVAYRLKVPNAVLGAWVLWRKGGVAPFTLFEFQRGKAMAGEIALALENSTLYHELSRQAQELATAQGDAARAEAQARTIVETAQEAIVLFDPSGVVWDANPKALEMFARSRAETVGHNLAEFALPLRLLDAFRNHVENSCRVGRDPIEGCIEVIALRKNGEELEVSTAVIETPQGKRLSSFARDITERKQAERAT
jgi:PAS domain S-box-containing protein